MPAGRPCKPVEQKRLIGRTPTTDASGHKLPEPVVVLAASNTPPKPPASLGDSGCEAWDRLWTAGQAWLSNETDYDILSRLCEAHDEREAMREQMAHDGYMVMGSRDQLRPHPLLVHVRALEAQMTQWETLLGFNPAARSKLGYAEVKRVSKLDELMARRRGAAV
jgi:P27 family predicted phage terminase small subunit